MLFRSYGEIMLDASQKFHNPEYLTRATAAFRQAITLSPGKVGPHIGLGLCLSQAGNLTGAIAEIRKARELYPRSNYVASIAKLLAKRERG